MYSGIFNMVLISFIVGFSGNKLFNKKNRSSKNSIKWGCIIGSLATILHLILISM